VSNVVTKSTTERGVVQKLGGGIRLENEGIPTQETWKRNDERKKEAEPVWRNRPIPVLPNTVGASPLKNGMVVSGKED
jgi:hypothetical protein